RSRHFGRIFRQGIVVNVLNPKTALFFLAFLPQFVDPDRSAAPQIAVLGLMWVALGLLSDSVYALLSGTVGGALKRSSAFSRAARHRDRRDGRPRARGQPGPRGLPGRGPPGGEPEALQARLGAVQARRAHGGGGGRSQARWVALRDDRRAVHGGVEGGHAGDRA